MAYNQQVFPHENDPVEFGRSLSPGELEGLLHQLRADQQCVITIKEPSTGVSELRLDGSKTYFCVVTDRWIGFAFTQNASSARDTVRKGVESYLKKIN